jgi:hypothetical protein
MVLQKKGSVWPGLIACLLLTVLLAACSSGAPTLVLPRATPTPISSHVSPTPTLGAPGCHPPSPLEISNQGFPEAQGTTPARDLWSLFLGGVPPVNEYRKIIWRDGESFQDPIQVVAFGPHGERLQPLFLERHSGSNWARPGAEWGTAFKFPGAGCWDLRVTGGKTVGDVWVIIS